MGRVRATRWSRSRAGSPRSGSAAGDTVAIMLTNRPEFHPVDSAAMHLGATPFSIYNTYTPEQIKYLVNDAATRVLVTEQAFLDTVLKAKEGADKLEHVVVIDGDAPEGGMTLDDLIAKRRRRLRLRGRVEGGRAGRHPDADLHVGHDRRPKGVQLTHKNLLDGREGLPRHHRLPRGGERGLVAADGAHRRARVLALHPDPARLHDHVLPRPAPGRRRTCPRCGRRGSSPSRASGRS